MKLLMPYPCPQRYIFKNSKWEICKLFKRIWKSDVVSKRNETYPTLVYALVDMHYAILNASFLYHMCGPMDATMNSHPHIYGVHVTTFEVKVQNPKILNYNSNKK